MELGFIPSLYTVYPFYPALCLLYANTLGGLDLMMSKLYHAITFFFFLLFLRDMHHLFDILPNVCVFSY